MHPTGPELSIKMKFTFPWIRNASLAIAIPAMLSGLPGVAVAADLEGLFDVGGRSYSLQEIELDVLLGERFSARGWKDARVHFMVNCASVGCPPLRRRIYTAENIDPMLAENTRRALDTPLHLDRAGDVLRLSSLFDWYAADFVGQSGSVEAFIRDHGSSSAKAKLEATDAVEFIDYDWSLNSPENFDRLLSARDASTSPRDRDR